MNCFEIVAHRGAPIDCPENTIAAFERAISMGADSVEFDVRLTKDHVPVVYHYYYLEGFTNLPGPIFDCTLEQLKSAQYSGNYADRQQTQIPTLRETLETIGGRIGLELEIKGPEPEAPLIIGRMLRDYWSLWDELEVTSYEPQLLVTLQAECPGVEVDLLCPRSEPWMGPDVVAYMAVQGALQSGARAVHLHPTQLTDGIVNTVRRAGIEIHSWEANDLESLELLRGHGIPRICTDDLALALAYRVEMAG
jgi:glycerophosphoryl diester phosphodiesterase